MDSLKAVCEEFGVKEPDQTFGFTFDKEANRWCLFIDYEALSNWLK